MISRLLTAAIGLPILFAIVWAGGFWIRGLVAAVAALAAWELARMARAWGQDPHPVIVAVLAAVVTAPWTTPGIFYDSPVVMVLAGLLAVLAAVALLPNRRSDDTIAATLPSPAVVLYAGLTLFHVTGLSLLTDGRDWVFLLIGVVFSTDTSAYAVGRLIGRHSLAPSISPRKTWEGAVGGLIGGAVAGIVISVLLDLPLRPLEAGLLSAAAACVGQLGDLYISVLKRAAGFGDSGAILPGHGGILDRVDSVLWAAIAVFWWAWLTVS